MNVIKIEAFKDRFKSILKSRLGSFLAVQNLPEGYLQSSISALEDCIAEVKQNSDYPSLELELQKLEDAFFSKIRKLERSVSAADAAKSAFFATLRLFVAQGIKASDFINSAKERDLNEEEKRFLAAHSEMARQVAEELVELADELAAVQRLIAEAPVKDAMVQNLINSGAEDGELSEEEAAFLQVHPVVALALNEAKARGLKPDADAGSDSEVEEKEEKEAEIQPNPRIRFLADQLLEMRTEAEREEKEVAAARHARRMVLEELRAAIMARMRPGMNQAELEDLQTEYLQVEDWNDRETSYNNNLQRASAAVVRNLKIAYGDLSDQRINDIISEIKGIILDRIIENKEQSERSRKVDNKESVDVRPWLRENRAVLIDESAPGHQAVLRESRQYLNSLVSLNQQAWRNFDPNAERHPRAAHNSCFNQPAVKESLAYYYIAFTDPKYVPSVMQQEHYIAALLGQLADIRTAHNDEDPVYQQNQTTCLDRPSCPPGHLTRIGAAGEGHPIAAVKVGVVLVPELIRSRINSMAEVFFNSLANLTIKEKALQSFQNISVGSVQEIIEGPNTVSQGEMKFREKALAVFGLAFNQITNRYEINQQTIDDIENAIYNLELQAAPENQRFGVQRRQLTAKEREQILYNFLDPAAQYLDILKNQFKRSLSQEELTRYEFRKSLSQENLLRLEALETKSGRPLSEEEFIASNLVEPAGQVETLATDYADLLQAEIDTADTELRKVNDTFQHIEDYENSQAYKDAILALKQRFAPMAVERRITEKLIERGHFANGEAIVQSVTRARNEKLLSTYLLQSISNHAWSKRHTYGLKQSDASAEALKQCRPDWQIIDRTGTAKEKNDIAKAFQDELTVLVLGGSEAIQSVALIPVVGDYKENAENGKVIGLQKCQTLDVPNTGPAPGVRGVMGSDIMYPRMPVIHPQQLTSRGFAQGRRIPIFQIPLALTFPRRGVGNLPVGVLEQLTQHNISMDNLQVFWSVQDMPWRDQPLLLRPHPWLHPTAPREGGVLQNSNILVGICDVDAAMSSVTSIEGVSTGPDASGQMRYLDAQMPILGIETANSHGFYSLCIDPAGQRAALTLHWLLNEPDNAAVDGLLQGHDPILSSLVDFLGFTLPNSTITTATNPEKIWTPFFALKALIYGGQPTHDTVRDVSRYRLGGSEGNKAVSGAKGQRGHQLAENLFLAHRFSNEADLGRRRKLILTAMQQAQDVKNPAIVVTVGRKPKREPVSNEQRSRYFQLLLQAYLKASLALEELNHLKEVATDMGRVARETEEKTQAELQKVNFVELARQPAPHEEVVRPVHQQLLAAEPQVVVHVPAAANAVAQRIAEVRRARQDRERQAAALGAGQVVRPGLLPQQLPEPQLVVQAPANPLAQRGEAEERVERARQDGAAALQVVRPGLPQQVPAANLLAQRIAEVRRARQDRERQAAALPAPRD